MTTLYVPYNYDKGYPIGYQGYETEDEAYAEMYQHMAEEGISYDDSDTCDLIRLKVFKDDNPYVDRWICYDEDSYDGAPDGDRKYGQGSNASEAVEDYLELI